MTFAGSVNPEASSEAGNDARPDGAGSCPTPEAPSSPQGARVPAQQSIFGGETLYRCALMDPPWLERGGGKSVRGAQRHYPLMDVQSIRRTILDSGKWTMAEDAHLYMWVTDNFLEDALWLMGELGFRYIRTIQWVKVAPGLTLEIGIGQYARGAHEMMLLGVRGKGLDPAVCTDRRDLPSVLLAPTPRDEKGRRIHSRKPPASYDWIEARSKGPRIEFFARIGRPGWDVWGNQAPQLSTPEHPAALEALEVSAETSNLLLDQLTEDE